MNLQWFIKIGQSLINVLFFDNRFVVAEQTCIYLY